MCYTFGMYLLSYQHPAATHEVFVELVVQLYPVGHEDKTPVSGNLSQYLLGKKIIDTLFPEPCVCQNTPSFPRLDSIPCKARMALFAPKY